MKTTVTFRPVEKIWTAPPSRAYVWYRSDSIEQRADRNLIHKEVKKVISTILTGFKEKVDPKEIKYSAYAGCSCGCSPGFILPVRLGVDLFINITKK
jgi:hypothetical protein